MDYGWILMTNTMQKVFSGIEFTLSITETNIDSLIVNRIHYLDMYTILVINEPIQITIKINNPHKILFVYDHFLHELFETSFLEILEFLRIIDIDTFNLIKKECKNWKEDGF